MPSLFRKVSQILTGKNSNSHEQHTEGTLNNNDPSHNTTPRNVPLPTSPLKDIPRNILAFRTITKLLSQIQQERAFEVYTPAILSPEDRLELKLSNAFSTLAVIEHEVVAIVTKRTAVTLKIVASTQTSTNEEPLVIPSPSGFVSQVWHLLVTQNYRRGDPQPPTLPIGEPIICDAGILAGTDLVDDETLKLQVNAYW
ncbi:hypothetical protein BYT27DRAFT_7213579 [Phlegmacium glaucopus]|nr:hypothetical protein BYT27DRAFT_7213579 [Phlegmacium glaucopus]